jgi:cysteine dioxygenase
MISNLDQLFKKITENLETSYTLENTKIYMEQYCGDDWESFVVNNFQSVCYNRNLVFRTNIAEMYVITWSTNCESCIHDHPERGCIMKIVRGKLQEYIYTRSEDMNVTLMDTIMLTPDDKNIGYIIGNDVLHKIKNVSDDISVSIHIYAKPNYVCNKYHELKS